MPLIVITGASQGIGRAIAERFAKEPASRLVLIARTASNLERVARRCEDLGALTKVCPVDVTASGAVNEVARRIIHEYGAPDIVVNNAGLFSPGSLMDTSVKEFRAQVETNLTSAFIVTRAFLGSMMRQRAGHIFFMASVASLQAYDGGAAYCAAKHGMLGLARVVRQETKDHGIGVTTLLPGAVRTPSWDGTDLPDERFMGAVQIAEAVVGACKMGPRTVVEEMLLRPLLGDI